MSVIDNEKLDNIEHDLALNPNLPLSSLFSSWSATDYGALYLSDLTGYPTLQKRLPKMPPDEDQRHWTWFAGKESMELSVYFIESIKKIYEEYTGQSLADATVLDYGAGWGRLTRMMLQYVPGEQVHACDADMKSVDLYNSLGFESPAIKVPTSPTELPYATGYFDLVWLYSILTHLSADFADAVMSSLHRVVKPGGLLLVTIRPSSFWTENALVDNDPAIEEMVAEHERNGFAHRAQSPYWGDTSMSVDYMQRKWPQWKVVKVKDDVKHQVEVYLTPK